MYISMQISVLFFSFCLIACSNPTIHTQSTQEDTVGAFTDLTDTGDIIDTSEPLPSASIPNPFVVEEDQSLGLVNTSFDLEEVLEYGYLQDACAWYEQYPDDEYFELLCGKYMFFYEGFGGMGIPKPLFDFVNSEFRDYLGDGFERYGMIADPYSPDKNPIGYGEGSPMGSVKTMAYSCASCHFGQLPDGRYSVGMANYDYDIGKQFLTFMLLPSSVMWGFKDEEHSAEALSIIDPMRRKIQGNPLLLATMGWELLPLLWESDISASQMSKETEEAYASWQSGTMDVFIAPLPIDDQVHVVAKIPTLWNIPNREEQERFSMQNAQLSWIGTSPSVEHFLRGFLALGDSGWTIEDVRPLIRYLETLQAPKTLENLNPASLERGKELFWNSCIDCHQGYQGSSIELFDYEEIGTDEQMKYTLDADLDGEVCCGIDAHTTHQIKAPRLTGVWGKERLLHNGSVDNLDQLLCLHSTRDDETPIFGNVGHWYGCDFSVQDKIDIREFLKSL